MIFARCVLELADLDRSTVVGVGVSMPPVDEDNDVVHVCSELIRSVANKVRGLYSYCLLILCCYFVI